MADVLSAGCHSTTACVTRHLREVILVIMGRKMKW